MILTDQILKIAKRITEKIRQQVNIDDIHIGFVPGYAITNVIFILRQLEEKYLAKQNDLHFGRILKKAERIIENMIRRQVNIDDMHFGFVPGYAITNVIFILRQLEKYLAKKDLCITIADWEKVFDRVPRDVVWWALRKLGVEEWLVKIVQPMYINTRSCVKVHGTFSDYFLVQVG